VVVRGDKRIELDETFRVRLMLAQNATLVDSIAVGTIANDDSIGPNLCGNSGFETNLTGWVAFGTGGASLSRVQGGAHGGSWSAKVTTLAALTYGIDDASNWVTVNAENTAYLYRAWVKSTDSNASARMEVRELRDEDEVEQTIVSNVVTLSGTWQLLNLMVETQRDDTTLDLKFYSTGLTGQSFQVDDVSIVRVPPNVGAPAPPPVEFRARVTPNPARAAAKLRFSTTRPGPLRVRLFDVSGREVSRMMDEADAPAGERSLAIGARGGARLGPGIYWYRIEAREGTLTGRVALLE
jgi:hypothetical protein